MANVNGVSGDRLRSFIERVERLQEEKSALSQDISDVFKEAKMSGFEPKIMREVIKKRKLDKHERDEQEYLLDTYLKALNG